MDWRIASLGLLLDGVSFFSSSLVTMIGLPEYSGGAVVVQVLLMSAGLFLTVFSLIKRTPLSTPSSEVLMLASAFIIYLALLVFGGLAMASSPYGYRARTYPTIIHVV